MGLKEGLTDFFYYCPETGRLSRWITTLSRKYIITLDHKNEITKKTFDYSMSKDFYELM